MRQTVGESGNFFTAHILNGIKQIDRWLVQQKWFVLRERRIGVAGITDVVVDKQLIQSGILHYSGQIGIAKSGKIVISLAFIAVTDGFATLLRVEIADRQ